MSALLNPLSFVVSCLSGWLNQHQQHVIDYLTEENHIFANSWVIDGSASPMINAVDSPPALKN